MTMMTKSLFAVLGFTAFSSATASIDYVVLDQGKVRPYWVNAGKQRHMQVPKSAMRNGVEICVALGFTIESSGIPANIVVLKTQSNKPSDDDDVKRIQNEARQAVSEWRFNPAAENPDRKPVYTYSKMAMSLIPSARPSDAAKEHSRSIEQQCDIPDFVEAVKRGDFKDAGKP